MSKMDETVWIMRDGAVEQTTFRALFDYLPMTCRADGIGPKHWAVADGERWSVYVRPTSAGPDIRLRSYDTEDEAIADVEGIWIRELYDSDEIELFATQEAANAALRDLLDD